MDKVLAEATSLLITTKKGSGLLGRGWGRLTSSDDLRRVLEILDEGLTILREAVTCHVSWCGAQNAAALIPAVRSLR